VTSMNRKNGLRHTPCSYQAPPDVQRSYVSVLACWFDFVSVAGKTC